MNNSETNDELIYAVVERSIFRKEFTYDKFNEIYNAPSYVDTKEYGSSSYDDIKVLTIITHNIYQLPSKFPKKLRYLSLKANNNNNTRSYLNDLSKSFDNINTEIAPLPDNMDSLTIIGFTNMHYLPKLPDSISWLTILRCGVLELPKLPEHLNNLCVMYCYSLEKMPSLPMELEMLDCDYNNLIELPEIPKSVEIIRCSYNKLKYLPESLGNTCIYAEHNKLIDIPDSFLNFKGDPMMIPGFSFDNNPINDLIIKYFMVKNRWLSPIGNYINFRKKYQKRFVSKIENWYLECKYNPEYKYCRDRLEIEYNDMFKRI